uniref:Ig-like domain-containing protein n=1 Tax=Dicentrarchus labrax TaxID=13489 RepID=A0A8P4GTP8_DICLA
SAAVTGSALYYCAVRPTVTANPQSLGREGESVTLRCRYETTVSNIVLYWYRHSDLQAPQFILWKGAKGITTEYIPDKRYESKTTDSSTELTIRKLTLADTALYYCSSSPPQLLIMEYSEKIARLSLTHDKNSKEFHLEISSAAVTDSAVYYCAVRPTVTGNTKTLYKNLTAPH